MEQDKWSQPGWKIEQRYSSKVLLGNWADERLKFTREPKTAESANREDYRPHWDFRPDVSHRGYALLRAEGRPFKQLLGHDCQPPSHYMVTQYGASYGTKNANVLPALQPNRPTSARGVDSLRPADRRHVEKEQSRFPSVSVYGSSYQRHPLSAFCQSRFARASRPLSSHFHASNHINKDLDLRQRPLLQVPDVCV